MSLRFASLIKYEWVKLSFQQSGHLKKWFCWVTFNIKNSLNNFLQSAPEIKQDHPLNLSISVSGGRETNQDSLSKGDWRGKSSGWKSGTCPWIVVFRGSTSDGAGVSLLEKSTRKGESPVSLASRHVRCSSDESRSLGLERKWVVNFIQS